jgi:hypothetical protein
LWAMFDSQQLQGELTAATPATWSRDTKISVPI